MPYECLDYEGQDYECPTILTTDPLYRSEARAKITFMSRNGNEIFYTYDSFNPLARPFNILACDVRMAIGDAGSFSIVIEDHLKQVIKKNIGLGTKILIEIAKQGESYMKLFTGLVRSIRPQRSATNSLLYSITGAGSQIIFNERIVNFKRSAKRVAIDDPTPLPTDQRMQAHNLMKSLVEDTDIVPLKEPSLASSGGLTIEGISDEVTDFIDAIAPGLTDASSVANALAEITGSIWGVNNDDVYFRYPTQKHSGIIIKGVSSADDRANIVSYNTAAFDFEDTINMGEGFANRLYTLNAVSTKVTASSNKAGGSSTLTFLGIAQQFEATDNNITSAAFILSKVGDPSRQTQEVTGYLRADNNGYPTGATLASFAIPVSSIESSKTTLFVNDLKMKEGVIQAGSKYWWLLLAPIVDNSNTIRWHHDNDQTTANRFSATIPLVDKDPTKPGTQLEWIRSSTGPVYAFSTFSSIRHILEDSDPESIKLYGLIEAIVDLPAFEDDATLKKAMAQILQTSAKPKRVYSYNRLELPNNKLFLPGELVTVVDDLSDLDAQKNITAEIQDVSYNFDTSDNAVGLRYVDVRLLGFLDSVLDDALENNIC